MNSSGVRMDDSKWTVLGLIVIGIVSGFAKLLLSDETLTARKIIGRALLGAVTSMIACSALVYFADPNQLALWGFGSALGIVGQQGLEMAFNYWATKGKTQP